jgi:branched-chain amino acid transport system ATP-binding protein
MLAIDDLTVRYGAVEAVRGVSLGVERGEIVAVLGPNGAGKTTVLSTVMGLVRPAGGTVRFKGEDITGMDTELVVRRGLGLVPERRRIFKNLTVRENLRLGAAARQGKTTADQDLAELLELFPILRERMQQLAGFLSGGEAQQLAIARAVIGAPELLLLDEPSLGLAPKLVEGLFTLVAHLRERGLTILLVEQNAYQALEIADRAYVLRSGQIEAACSADELRDEQELMQAYLGLRGGRPAAAQATAPGAPGPGC